MRKLILFLTIFLLIPITYADITINIQKTEFSLGDKLEASVDIIQDQDFEGFFRLSVVCKNNTFEYYATPVSLKANVNKKINVEPMALFEDLLGDCYLDGILKTPQDYILEQAPSALFTITNALNIFLMQSSFITEPGTSINIKGSVKKINDENVDKANITLILDETPTTFIIKNGNIDYNFKIPPNIKSYTHFIDIIAEDPYTNKGKEVINLEINPIPTIILTNLNKESFIPSETLEVNVKLLDQADDIMDGIINFEIINPENGKIHMQTANSDSTIKYTWEKHSIPGEYKLRSFLDDIFTEDFVTMEKYEKLDINLEDSFLYIENVGNIRYNKKTTIILEDDNKNNYIIRKRINLKPREFTTIDLSKEVPAGNYNVEAEDTSFEDIAIEDNRNLGKKIEQSLSSITGNVIGNSDKSIMTPRAASFIIIIIILSLILVANRNKLKKLFKKRY